MTGAAGPLTASSPDVLAWPRAAALTDLLLGVGTTGGPAPGRRGEGCSAPSASLGASLEASLGAVVARARRTARDRGGPACVRIGTYQVIRTLDGGPHDPAEPPFRWTPRTARRTVGIGALAAVRDRRAATPSEAVGLVLARPRLLGGDGPSPGSCAEWIASLPQSGRSLVHAEATTWATQLWAALEWDRLGPAAVVGGPDRWWSRPGRPRVAVRGRADVRIETPGGAAHARGARTAHLLVLGGCPTAASRVALCLSALVDLLARGPDAVPERVVGWWPDCGKAWAVTTDARALEHAAAAVLRAVSAALALAPRPGPR